MERIGLSLEEIRDILGVSEQSQTPCVHVLALLERKLEQWMPLSRGLTLTSRGRFILV
jgi:DNA-binding transcriptional MerR regulator